MNFLKSKTVWGGILIGGAKILGVAVPLLSSGMFGPQAQGIVTGIGIILAAIGVKSAIFKSGQPGNPT